MFPFMHEDQLVLDRDNRKYNEQGCPLNFGHDFTLVEARSNAICQGFMDCQLCNIIDLRKQPD